MCAGPGETQETDIDAPLDITALVRERDTPEFPQRLDALAYRWSGVFPSTTPCGACGHPLARHAVVDPGLCGACACPGFHAPA